MSMFKNIEAGFRLFGSPEKLKKKLFLWGNKRILKELKIVNARDAVLGSGILRSEYYHDLADTSEQAEAMIDMDNRYADLIRPEAAR